MALCALSLSLLAGLAGGLSSASWAAAEGHVTGQLSGGDKRWPG